jgi:hypothetical protein
MTKLEDFAIHLAIDTAKLTAYVLTLRVTKAATKPGFSTPFSVILKPTINHCWRRYRIEL